MKETGKTGNPVMRIILCGAGAAIFTVLLSLLCSALILQERLPEEHIGLYTAIICGISAATACLIGAGSHAYKTAAFGIAICAVYISILLLAKAIAFPGTISGLISRTAIILLSGTAACLLTSFRRKGRGGRRRHAGR